MLVNLLASTNMQPWLSWPPPVGAQMGVLIG